MCDLYGGDVLVCLHSCRVRNAYMYDVFGICVTYTSYAGCAQCHSMM